MTVSAKDFSGNNLLIITPQKEIINPNSELTRDAASGVMQGTGGADVSVDYSISYFLHRFDHGFDLIS